MNNRKLTDNQRIARMWFINNHPLVQKWEEEGVRWDMHHWDKNLKKCNPQRYYLWVIDDLIPMTHKAHYHIHHSGKNHHCYGKHLPEDRRKHLHEKCSGVNSGRYGKHNTPEHNEAIRQSKLGDNNPMKRQELRDARCKAILCIELNQVFKSSLEASTVLNLPRAGIIGCLKGRRHTCGGYHWEYCNKEVTYNE